ncbi:MAG: hypothetical protein MZV70_31665 [Desulfobacterales bacterium]|nr:hypothetical protein [Desulfobacterales bacterium]
MMENDTVLAVEYKNSRDWDLPENVEKRQIGELWEKRSNGKCFFVMPKGKDDSGGHPAEGAGRVDNMNRTCRIVDELRPFARSI